MFRKSHLNFFSTLKCSLLNKNPPNLIQGESFKRCLVTRKRFYRKTGVLHNNGKYEVTLDQRKLKTPKGNIFFVESEPLALAVAAEWDSQKEHIVSSTMHLTALCNTVIDNPHNFTKEDIVKELVRYLDSDTVLFLTSEEDDLYSLQCKVWEPVIDWFCKRFDVEVQASRNIEGPVISPETRQILTKHLTSYNIWAVYGFKFGIEALKSVILGLACSERELTVENAVLLARLEEDYQSKQWGRVEWAHELNQQDLQGRVAAAMLFIYLNSSSSVIKSKASVA